MTATVSVVIPARDAADTIGEQITALGLAVPADREVEILVVDDGSRDATARVAEATGREAGLDVRVLTVPTSEGEPAARNLGWRAATGRIVLFCDADDRVGPRWLAALAAAAEDAGYATGPMETAGINPPDLADQRGLSIRSAPARDHDGVAFASGCNMGFRRDVLEAVDGFDESYLIGCDVEIGRRLHRKGIDVAWTADAVVEYRLRRGRAAFAQARRYARAQPRLGLRRREAATRILRLLRSTVAHPGRLASASGRQRLIWMAGTAVGLLGVLRG